MFDLEIIKNILVSFTSFFIIVGLFFFYIRIYQNWKEIQNINKKIEEERDELDKEELNSEIFSLTVDLSANYYKKKTSQEIDKLKRQKEYLMEEISILKIFKK